MFMDNIAKIFKLLSDVSRLRILMLVDKKELCVCQIMGVLEMSQPLISRNLSLLAGAGFLKSRREGKMMFYSVKRRLPQILASVMALLRELFSNEKSFLMDIDSLRECEEFQKRTGLCGMKGYRAFMEEKGERKVKKRRVGA